MRTNPNAETPDARARAQHHGSRVRDASRTLGRSIVAAGELYGRPLADVLTRQHEDLAEHAAESIYHWEQIDREQTADVDRLRERLSDALAFGRRATAAYLVLVEELETRAARRKADRPEILRRAHEVYMGRETPATEDGEAPF